MTAGVSAPGPGFLFGLDLVPLERAAALRRRSAGSLAERVVTPEEADWISGAAGTAADDAAGTAGARRFAVALAVKEAAVKAVGGRPEGFSWQDTTVRPLDPGTPDGEPFSGAPGTGEPDVVRTVLAALPAEQRRLFGCRVAGAVGRAAEELIGGPVRAAVCSGSVADQVLVVVALWPLGGEAR